MKILSIEVKAALNVSIANKFSKCVPDSLTLHQKNSEKCAKKSSQRPIDDVTVPLSDVIGSDVMTSDVNVGYGVQHRHSNSFEQVTYRKWAAISQNTLYFVYQEGGLKLLTMTVVSRAPPLPIFEKSEKNKNLQFLFYSRRSGEKSSKFWIKNLILMKNK